MWVSIHLIVAIIALIRPLDIDSPTRQFYLPFAAGTIVLSSAFLLFRRIPRWAGVVLVSGMIATAVRGVTAPWTITASALLGAWLMFSRLVFGTEPPMADSDHLVGALVITVAVVAMAKVTRPLRFINVMFGLWLAAAPWFLTGASTTASWAGTVVGIALIALSLPRGRRSAEHYGGWDRFVLRGSTCC